MFFPREEFEQRWERFEAALGEKGYDAAVIWQRTGGSYDRAGNAWWLTNYACQSSGQEMADGVSPIGRSFAAVIFRVGHEPELHIAENVETVDRRYVVVGQLTAHTDDLGLGVGRRLGELGIGGRVALIGEDFLPVPLYRSLASATNDIAWVPEESLIHVLQHHKSEREVALYREAGQISGDALTALMKGLIAGKRQCDAVADAAAIVIRGGGGYQRIACHHGTPSESAMWDYPLYGYSRDAPAPGDMVRGWVYGPILQGYWLDPGRSAVCGSKPSPERRKLIEDTVELLDAIIAEIRPGRTPRQAGVVGDQVASRLGYGLDSGAGIWEIYGHGLGTFGIGPVIPAHGAKDFKDDTGWWNVDEPFFGGQIYTAEVFVQEPGVGTATFEEILLVRDGDAERLTQTPLLFW